MTTRKKSLVKSKFEEINKRNKRHTRLILIACVKCFLHPKKFCFFWFSLMHFNLFKRQFVLCFTQIKLVNIRAEDIVDSNPKLTLGLIWTIILHFQVPSHFDCYCYFFFSIFSSKQNNRKKKQIYCGCFRTGGWFLFLCFSLIFVFSRRRRGILKFSAYIIYNRLTSLIKT